MLWREGAGHVVEPADPIFPQFKVKVILRRTEDKNTFLDRHLEKLEGNTVIACAGLDTRRHKEQDSTVYLYLSDRSQVTEADRETQPSMPGGRVLRSPLSYVGIHTVPTESGRFRSPRPVG